jgi:hypothetical protein
MKTLISFGLTCLMLITTQALAVEQVMVAQNQQNMAGGGMGNQSGGMGSMSGGMGSGSGMGSGHQRNRLS